MAAQAPDARQIFLEAVEKHAPEQWPAFLDSACSVDAALRERVEALLQAHGQYNHLLDGEGFVATVEQPPPERPGTQIGPYKLLQQIGEGGMGVVYMAEQEQPVRRRVALKIIKPGMDSRQVIARFEAERQALSLMDHPNIAKVLDAGTTASSRPYFVMELVKGIPITRYCDEKRLSLKERLELLIPVCQAIQHAHQKGIIHRDIKPSNILVAEYDQQSVPKVIDFGVAKATSQTLTELTMFTGFGQIVGTLEYMSPEQAKVNQLDIDTRSDIYSLGVLLYELLTGSTPFDKQRLRSAGWDEMLRIIREEEPQKPSTRLSSVGSAHDQSARGEEVGTAHPTLASIAAVRGTEPAKLARLVRGELDWIVMKALEKDRNRRYETANGLAMDIQRYLADEPVQACPPSALYRFRKFARRNKAGMAIGCVIALGVMLSVVGLAVNNWLVTSEKRQKVAALERVVEEKQRADENLAQARQAVKEYLLKTSDSPLLKSGDFQNLRKELLETAIPFYLEFVRQKQDDPDLEVERGTASEDLGFVRRQLGDLEQAVADFEQAESIFRRLSTTFPERPVYRLRLAAAHISRGDNLIDLGRLDSAEQAYQQALDLLEKLVAENTGPEYRESLARGVNNLGLLLKESSRPRDAEKMLSRSITLRKKLLDEQPRALELRRQLAQSWVNLGALQYSLRQAEDAQKSFQEAVDLLDPDVVPQLNSDASVPPQYQQGRAHAFNNLAVIHREGGRLIEAEQASREALAIKQKLADKFPSVPQYRHELARSLNNLGALLTDLNRRKDAQAAYEKAVDIYERLSADSHAPPLYAVELAGTYTNLGRLMGDDGQLEQSLPWLTKSVEILEAAFRKDSRLAKVRESLVVAYWARAMTLAGLGRFPLALLDWDRAIELDDGRYHIALRLKRASNHLNLQDHARATADAQAIADATPATGEDLYNAACVFAIAARTTGADGVVAESYAGRAVVLLRKAIAKGFKDVAHLGKDADLDSLRSRDDFKKLMQELEYKQNPEEAEQQETREPAIGSSAT